MQILPVSYGLHIFFPPQFYDLYSGDDDCSICPTHVIFFGGSCDIIDAKGLR